MGAPAPGLRRVPWYLVGPSTTNGSVPFQVDDAMLMFDKTTNRHRGECGPPPPFQAGLGACGQPGGCRSQLPFHLSS